MRWFESDLTSATPLTASRLILTYLIPCHLITTHTLPTEKLLEPYPRLQSLFLPLCRCIKKGELHKFDLALQEGEDEFVKRRIYLTLERGRDVALRNLLRKVLLARGFEEAKEGEKPVRPSRIPVAEFAAAISLGSQERIDNDEVECLLANMIYKVSQGIHHALPLRQDMPFLPATRAQSQGRCLFFLEGQLLDVANVSILMPDAQTRRLPPFSSIPWLPGASRQHFRSKTQTSRLVQTDAQAMTHMADCSAAV